MSTTKALAEIKDRRYPYMADEDLISLVEAGDPEAFAALYDRHIRLAYSLARRMMREQQAAEDLVQEAFIKVWRSAGHYRAERGSARTWILSMVHSGGIDRLRRTASRQRAQEHFEISTEKVQPSEAFEETWSSLRRDVVRQAIQALPPEQLEILELAYFRGHTHTEIAQLLELPLGTVKGRIRLGLKRMRDHIGSFGKVEPD